MKVRTHTTTWWCRKLLYVVGALLGPANLLAAQGWTLEREMAAAVLPLPDSLRPGAGVRVMSSAMVPTVLRESKNGMMCTIVTPGAEQFDARCYRLEFLKVVDYVRALSRSGVAAAVDARLRADAKKGRIVIPDHATAGYRMLGPSAAFDLRNNIAGSAIEKWQSIHIPFGRAEDMGIPTTEEGIMPFVMYSGTWWSHIMIVHTTTKLP
jgi:hypothetical protein